MLVRRAFSILRVSLVGCIFSVAAWTANAQPKDFFEQGLASYQNKQYAEARDAFQKQLDLGKSTPALLNNLALSVYALDQKPLALALWRKALSMQPSFTPARKGRDFLETKMNMRPLERDSMALWTHRTLESISLYEILWANALVLAMAGWFAFRYLGERAFAIEEEQPIPPFPTTTAVFVLLFLCTFTLTGLKFKDSLTERATITAAKASVRSLPSDDGVGLFDISGGAEVYVRQQQNGWTQVQNADGTAGWVKNSELLITSN